MKITLDSRQSAQQNAALYFERAKKARKKAEGARKALEKSKEKLLKQEKKGERKPVQRVQKKHWYEKFRWFISSEGFLCVAGRDASTNELIVKKHTEPHDIVFHTDMAGSPFCVVKTEKKDVGDVTKQEVATFVASFSKAWREGLATLDVFYVNPDQVSKTAQAGEFMKKGSFMIRGETTYLHPKLGLLIGKDGEGRIMIAAEQAVLHHCKKGYQIYQGKDKTSDVAKRLAKLLEAHPDDIIPLLPAGGVKLGRRLEH